jgi:GNAT superfamily N-acetyltransferase
VDLRRLTFRENVIPDDIRNVREIINSSNFFSAAEADVAAELVEERLSKGLKSDYYFLFAELDSRVIGYTCFGPIPCTIASYDLYWIAIHDEFRGQKIGKELLRRSEDIIIGLGGTRVYIETASRNQYEPTRAFYLRCEYREEAVLQDFYAPGDSKVIYVRELRSRT